MDVSFADERLGLIETHRAAETHLPYAVISTARARLSILRASPDLATLRSWRSFGLSPTAELPGMHTVRINEKWHMTIKFENDDRPRSVVLEVAEYNAGKAA